MPDNRSSAAETCSVMASVLVVAAVIVGAIAYFNRDTDVTSQPASAPALAGMTTGVGGGDR